MGYQLERESSKITLKVDHHVYIKTIIHPFDVTKIIQMPASPGQKLPMKPNPTMRKKGRDRPMSHTGRR